MSIYRRAHDHARNPTGPSSIALATASAEHVYRRVRYKLRNSQARWLGIFVLSVGDVSPS